MAAADSVLRPSAPSCRSVCWAFLHHDMSEVVSSCEQHVAHRLRGSECARWQGWLAAQSWSAFGLTLGPVAVAGGGSAVRNTHTHTL